LYEVYMLLHAFIASALSVVMLHHVLYVCQCATYLQHWICWASLTS
jgi:hypothetical protein